MELQLQVDEAPNVRLPPSLPPMQPSPRHSVASDTSLSSSRPSITQHGVVLMCGLPAWCSWQVPPERRGSGDSGPRALGLRLSADKFQVLYYEMLRAKEMMQALKG